MIITPHHCHLRNDKMKSLCSVVTCKNYSGHRFPKDAELRKKWLKALKRKEVEPSWKLTSNSVVCGSHFKPTDYVTTTKAGVKFSNDRYL